MGPIDATLNCLFKPFTFQGRATRSEFWWFMLATVLLGWALAAPFYWAIFGAMFDAALQERELLDAEVEARMTGAVSWTSISVLMIGSTWLWFSNLSVLVRRLHDIDRNGWWYWLLMVPFVGAIILMIFLLTEGDHGRNRFGPPAKGRAGKKQAQGKAGPSAEPVRKRIPKGLPGEPYNPVNELTTAEELRALRNSRMAN